MISFLVTIPNQTYTLVLRESSIFLSFSSGNLFYIFLSHNHQTRERLERGRDRLETG